MNFYQPVYVDPSSSYVLSPFPSPSSQILLISMRSPVLLYSKPRWNVTSYQKPPWIALSGINCTFIYVPKGASSYICKSTYHIAWELFAYLCPFWTFFLDGSDHIFLIYKYFISQSHPGPSTWHAAGTIDIVVVFFFFLKLRLLSVIRWHLYISVANNYWIFFTNFYEWYFRQKSFLTTLLLLKENFAMIEVPSA